MITEFFTNSVFFGVLVSLTGYEIEIGRASCRERVSSPV